MGSRRLAFGFLGMSLWLAPLAASAANVIISPASHAAPLMSPLGILALTLLAASAGVYLLSRRPVAASLALAGIALGSMLVAGAYANGYSELKVSGADCLKRTVFEFEDDKYEVLRSECTNDIVIVSLDGCEEEGVEGNNITTLPAPDGPCVPGRVLSTDEACFLPGCS